VQANARLSIERRDWRARAGWAIAEVDVWDVWNDEGRYLAHGAQAMFIRGAPGEPPVIDALDR
jgi:hypothetical protein